MKHIKENSWDEFDKLIKQAAIESSIAVEANDSIILDLLNDKITDPKKREILSEKIANDRELSAKFELLKEALEEFENDDASSPQTESICGQIILAFQDHVTSALRLIRSTCEATTLEPIAIATRGSSETSDSVAHQFQQSFGPTEAALTVQRIDEQHVNLHLKLDHKGEKLRDGRATLKRNGDLHESVRIREGYADFENLPLAHYALEVNVEGENVGQLSLDFIKI